MKERRWATDDAVQTEEPRLCLAFLSQHRDRRPRPEEVTHSRRHEESSKFCFRAKSRSNADGVRTDGYMYLWDQEGKEMRLEIGITEEQIAGKNTGGG
jgi:hypothetical protein